MNYDQIRQHYQQTGQLYEDHDFTTTSDDGMKWKRPYEISKTPHFTIDTTNRNDFVQGDLEDCWFTSAVISLVTTGHLKLEQQDFDDTTKYCGAFHFQFWQYNKWTQIIVDDRLPINHQNERPAYLHSANGQQFLGALLEKAYAKLNGGFYKALNGGQAAEALMDMTSGWVEYIRVSDDDNVQLINRIKDALKAKLPLIASITEDQTSFEPRTMDNGLVINHGYVVIDLKQVVDRNGHDVCLIHLRDPKAIGGWNGPWSNDSNSWMTLTDDKMRTTLKMATKQQGPGEFWISGEDFIENVTNIEICQLTKSDRHISIAHGQWKVGSSDDTFYNDPQFELFVNGKSDTSEVINFTLELTQMDRRRQGLHHLAIKFRLFKLDNVDTIPLNPDQLDKMTSISTKKLYVTNRSFIESFIDVPSGRFMAIASTESTKDERFPVNFTFRLITNSQKSSIKNAKT